MPDRRLHTRDAAEWASTLRAGERVLLCGTVYTARDAAHKRLIAALQKGAPLPFPLDGAAVYYAGPTPAVGDLAIGSIGPTTSSRMDPYTPLLLQNGLKVMIGKGDRSADVVAAMQANGAVYFAAVGGCGALYARCVQSCEVVAYDDLGCESVKRLQVNDFPLLVAIDSRGASVYSHER